MEFAETCLSSVSSNLNSLNSDLSSLAAKLGSTARDYYLRSEATDFGYVTDEGFGFRSL